MDSLCKKHPHSSEITAKQCHEKLLGKQANRKLARVAMEPHMYKQVKCDPPEVMKVGTIEVVYFFKAVPLFGSIGYYDHPTK